MTDKVEVIQALQPQDFEKPDLSEMHRSELEAEVVHFAKLGERFRQAIANIVRDFEDEGDRVYLGSTNDADDLREIDALLSDAGNELFCPWMHGSDLYGDLRALRSELADRISHTEMLVEALSQIANWEPAEFAFPDDWADQIASCKECQRYAGHPIQGGICDTHRRPIWDRERHAAHQDIVRGLVAQRVARAALSSINGEKGRG